MSNDAKIALSAPDDATHPVMEMFTSAKAQQYIKPFLPEGVDPIRVAASVMLAMQNDKSGTLAKCTPKSLILGVARIQQWGLELGTTAHLLPFKDKSGTYEATPTADYKGLAELMVRSGAVRFVQAKVVYDGDFFEYSLGTDARLVHRPGPKAGRGQITHAYCVLDLPFGRQVFDVMMAEDIDEIRQRFSKQWKEGPLKPWYAMKTIVRQVSKLVPKNPRLAKALAVMHEDREIDLEPDAPQTAALNAGDTDPGQILAQDRAIAAAEDDDNAPPF